MTQLLQQLFRIPIKTLKCATFFRNVATTNCLRKNYEGDGKTTVTMLNREHKQLIMIDSFGDHGFRLNNGIFVIGPMAAFTKTILQWNVVTVEDVTPESLSLFTLLEPKLDILILGTGDKRQQLKPEILQFLKLHKINTEILPTEKACATFNFLNAERRYVAGAFIPPTEVNIYPEEMILLDPAKDEHGPYIM